MGLIFDGKNIETDFTMNGIAFPLHVEAKPDYSFPDKDYNAYHVPGRNGDVLVDLGSYKNVQRSYYVSCGTYGIFNYLDIARQITHWLTKSSGYRMLTDTYEPDVIMFACFRSAAVINRVTDQGARIQIIFDCKPQKYLKRYYPDSPGTSAGYTIGELDSSGIYISSYPDYYPYDAKPRIELTTATSFSDGLIKFKDSKNVTTELRIQNPPPGVKMIIDCEMEEVYDGVTGSSLNNYVKLPDNRFPYLDGGFVQVTTNFQTYHSIDGYITIHARYWTL